MNISDKNATKWLKKLIRKKEETREKGKRKKC